jgi:hypothetical protein
MYAMAAGNAVSQIVGQWTLPPLILHPFSGEDTAEKLLEGSKAQLMLNGLIPSGGKDPDWLKATLLRARVQEVRMLYFLGRDILRWLEQCVDFAERTPGLCKRGIKAQSFAAYLIEKTPPSITQKLQVWGVSDQRSVFSRAIGVTCALNEPPTADTFTPLCLENYHRFLDYFYVCYQNLEPFTELEAENFSVEIYASAEYSQMLEEQWKAE